MASVLIFTVAAKGHIGLVRKGGQQIQDPAGLRFFHFLPKLARKSSPRPVISCLFSFLEQVLAGGEVRKPDIIIVFPGEFRFWNPARRPANRTQAKAFSFFPW
jgi:hypothetical protein